MSEVSIIVETTDHRFHVLPCTFTNVWRYFDSIIEATEPDLEDVIPVPLSSDEFDKWMYFAHLYNSSYVELIRVNKIDRNAVKDIQTVKSIEYEVLIRTMDFHNDRWMLYCIKDEGTDEELLRWYYELGCIVYQNMIECFNGNIINGFTVLSRIWLTGLVRQIYELVEGVSEERRRECMIVLGIIHNSWVKDCCQNELLWKKIDWRMMMRLKVSHIVDLAKQPSKDHACIISHSVEMLCYDGNPVEYEHCCNNIPDDGSFIKYPDCYGDDVDMLDKDDNRELCCRIMRFCIDRSKKTRPNSEDFNKLLDLSPYAGESSRTSHVGILRHFNTEAMCANLRNGQISYSDLAEYLGREYYDLMREAQLLKLELAADEWRTNVSMDTT